MKGYIQDDKNTLHLPRQDVEIRGRSAMNCDKSGQSVVIKADLYYGFTTSESVKKIERKKIFRVIGTMF